MGTVGVSRFSIENFLSHKTKTLRKRTLLCFRKVLVSKNFLDKGGGGVSRFSVENLLSHSAEKHPRGTPQCFITFGSQKKCA